MKEELITFIQQNNLSPFSTSKTYIKPPESIYKTRDAKSIHNKILSLISKNFIFSETYNLFNALEFPNTKEKLEQRQSLFKSIPQLNNEILKKLQKLKPTWKPKYETIAVTEDEATFVELQKLSCPSQLITNEQDILDLQNYDLVQAINCDETSIHIEKLPQSIFVDSLQEIYLERYLELLSSWQPNLEILKQIPAQEIQELIQQLSPTLKLIQDSKTQILSREKLDEKIEHINEKINEKIKQLTISGNELLNIVAQGKMPKEIQTIIETQIQEHNIPLEILNIKIPLEIDEQELDKLIKRQSANEFTDLAMKIKSSAEQLKQIPKQLEKLKALILIIDFYAGIKKFSIFNYPTIQDNLNIQNSISLLIDNPKPISFQLDQEYKCSILTGANSGGKTTLLEHIIQLITLTQLGLSTPGQVSMPLYSDVYYFAKNKGSASKGAFETLLNQMSQIKPGNQTLILADEIEAVTEPGVAGKIISATAEYFIQQNCFLIIATHLGQEIQPILPNKTRIDGIEAKGLDNNFNLIIDHNPVLGRLAHSTPELIVEKLASSTQEEYYKFLNTKIKQSNQK